MSLRDWIVEYSKGNNLGFFWRLFNIRSRAHSKLLRNVLTFIISRTAHRRGGYIGKEAVIKGIPVLPHGLHGIYISRFAEIGKNCLIYQNVTIGEINRSAPKIGDECLIGAGAVIIGNITIGNNVKIGAGVVVHTDIPDYSTVVAQPPRIIERKANYD